MSFVSVDPFPDPFRDVGMGNEPDTVAHVLKIRRDLKPVSVRVLEIDRVGNASV
ncbi:MAG: hypothetical protein V3T56_10685 [Gemmatimonadales bacterium]